MRSGRRVSRLVPIKAAREADFRRVDLYTVAARVGVQRGQETRRKRRGVERERERGKKRRPILPYAKARFNFRSFRMRQSIFFLFFFFSALVDSRG